MPGARRCSCWEASSQRGGGRRALRRFVVMTVRGLCFVPVSLWISCVVVAVSSFRVHCSSRTENTATSESAVLSLLHRRGADAKARCE